MAEQGEPMYHGELRAMIDRLSSLDRTLTEMRSDIRHLTNGLIGLYLFILAVAGLALTFFRTAPPAS
jgi:hypothetical protein